MKPSSRFESKDDKNFRWKALSIRNDTIIDDDVLQVSNDMVPLPKGLQIIKDFLTEEETTNLLAEIQQEGFIREGFEQKRKVQRYTVPSKGSAAECTQEEEKPMPSILRTIVQRLETKTGLRPQNVSVEEYSAITQKITQFGSNGYNGVVTSFEWTDLCQCEKQNCFCFTADIPLRIPAVKHLNEPKERHPTCWDLKSPDHWTDLRVEPNSVVLQTGDCLWNWRSRISAYPEKEYQKGAKFTVLKFCNIPQSNTSKVPRSGGEKSKSRNGIDYDKFGFVGSPDTYYRPDPMPPMEDLLTIIVTTSPIKSNPSTEVIEHCFGTFLKNGNDFAIKCRKVIVCDGCRQVDDENETVSRRHTNAKQAMRNGICTSEQAENYKLYKRALRELCANASDSSPFKNAIVEELKTRHGYGYALRHALRHCVSTPYVIVVQHDRAFMRPAPVFETLKAMWYHRNLKYVTMSMRSNLMYRDIFYSKYGKTYSAEYQEMVLRLPELNLDSSLYGPNSYSTKNMTFANDEVRKKCDAFADTYNVSNQHLDQLEWLKEHPNVIEPGKQQLTLSPVFFWYDNVHIAETAHYRDFVFDPFYKMVAKGGFVEDKLSPILTRTLERLGLKEGHARFGCYLLDDHSGRYFTGHLDGGSFMVKAQKQQLAKAAIERNLYGGKAKDVVEEIQSMQ